MIYDIATFVLGSGLVLLAIWVFRQICKMLLPREKAPALVISDFNFYKGDEWSPEQMRARSERRDAQVKVIYEIGRIIGKPPERTEGTYEQER